MNVLTIKPFYPNCVKTYIRCNDFSSAEAMATLCSCSDRSFHLKTVRQTSEFVVYYRFVSSKRGDVNFSQTGKHVVSPQPKNGSDFILFAHRALVEV
jgi:hypothetical protein